MKITVDGPAQEAAKPFPKLMACVDGNNEGMIVLFNCRSQGMVVSPGKAWDIGEWSSSWNNDVFNDFIGTVTLQND
jgi:hypothetical protein